MSNHLIVNKQPIKMIDVSHLAEHPMRNKDQRDHKQKKKTTSDESSVVAFFSLDPTRSRQLRTTLEARKSIIQCLRPDISSYGSCRHDVVVCLFKRNPQNSRKQYL